VARTFRSTGRQQYAASFVSKAPTPARITKTGRIIQAHRGSNLPLGVVFSRYVQRDNKLIGTRSDRLPIHKLLGPSGADAALKRKSELDAIVADLGTILQSNILSQVDRLLNRSRADRAA
jgi:hypothetical protein